MLVNRLGDIGLALGISACFLVFKTTDYAIMFSLVPNVLSKNITFFGFYVNILTIISLLIF
jgi:NADH:ubiquinone oxidoreductase subunit 5 (subunit L)/multisubunit Na+/H+ antiporter MnhA subunit